MDVEHFEKTLTRVSTSPLESPGDLADLLEPSYKESVRRFKQRERLVNFDRWREFHLNMRELHLRLADEHQVKADNLIEIVVDVVDVVDEVSLQSSFNPRPLDPVELQRAQQGEYTERRRKGREL